MKNLFKAFAAFCCMLLLACGSLAAASNPIGPVPAKYSFGQGGDTNHVSDFLVLGAALKAEVMPLPFQQYGGSVFSAGFNGNHFLLLSVLLSMTLLVMAHKNSFETDIYEFYHRNTDGIITFESAEAQKVHFTRATLAKIMRVGGIIFALAALGSIIW